MATVNLIDSDNMEQLIVECLDIIHIENERKASVIENSLIAVCMLKEAARTAKEAGPEETAVFEFFVRGLYSQIEMRNKENHFTELVEKLTVIRKLH